MVAREAKSKEEAKIKASNDRKSLIDQKQALELAHGEKLKRCCTVCNSDDYKRLCNDCD